MFHVFCITAGPDDLIPKFFINGIETLLSLINRLLNRLFQSGQYPDNWYNSIIVTLYKKGDINDVNNYQGISLENVFSKLYASIINRRIRNFQKHNPASNQVILQ